MNDFERISNKSNLLFHVVPDGVMIKIEYDEDEANARTPPTMVQSNSCARQSSRTLRELLTNRGALSGLNVPMVTNSDLASYATSHAISVAQGLHSQAVNPSMAGENTSYIWVLY